MSRITTIIKTPQGQVDIVHPDHMVVSLSDEWHGKTYQANVRLAVLDTDKVLPDTSRVRELATP